MQNTTLIVIRSLEMESGGVSAVVRILWPHLKKKEIFLCETAFSRVTNVISTKKYKSFYNLLKETSPKNVHFHGMWNLNLLLTYFFFKKINIIVTPHGMLSKWALKQNPIRKKLFLIFLGLIDRVITFQALTKNEAEDIRSIFYESKIHVIGNPISINKVAINKTAQHRSGIISIGRICEQKNSLEFLSTLKILESSKQWETPIDFYGWSSNKNYLKKFKFKIKESKTSNYKGKVRFDNVINVLKKYKYFIIYSNFEGFPMAAIEALSAGCIVIGNHSSGLEDIRTNRNVHIISGNMHKYLTGLRKLIIKDLNYVHDNLGIINFTPSKISSKLKKLYGV